MPDPSKKSPQKEPFENNKHAKDFGLLNVKHGICGTIAVLLALYYEKKFTPSTEGITHTDLLKDMRASYSAFTQGTSGDTALPFIVQELMGFLTWVINITHLANEILNFTRSFPGYETFTFYEYLTEINKAPCSTKLSIALPPNAVLAYLAHKQIGVVYHRGVQNLTYVPTVDTSSNPYILGLSSASFRGDTKPHPYNGLAHWVYMKDGKIYSWGQKFESLRALNSFCRAGFEICYFIQLTGLQTKKSSKGSYVPPIILQQNENKFEEDSDEWFSPKEKEKLE